MLRSPLRNAFFLVVGLGLATGIPALAQTTDTSSSPATDESTAEAALKKIEKTDLPKAKKDEAADKSIVTFLQNEQKKDPGDTTIAGLLTTANDNVTAAGQNVTALENQEKTLKGEIKTDEALVSSEQLATRITNVQASVTKENTALDTAYSAYKAATEQKAQETALRQIAAATAKLEELIRQLGALKAKQAKETAAPTPAKSADDTPKKGKTSF